MTTVRICRCGGAYIEVAEDCLSPVTCGAAECGGVEVTAAEWELPSPETRTSREPRIELASNDRPS